MKRSFALAALIVTIGAVACTDKLTSGPDEPPGSTTPGDTNPSPAGLVVSNPTLGGAAASASNVQSAASSSGVSYVSAEPETFPAALRATLRNSNAGPNAPSRSIALTNGGFDPVDIAAEPGDELRLEVVMTGSSVTLTIKVPPRRPPKIVRTFPQKGRIDVALNVQIVVVFSEPVNPVTVTAASLRLRDNDQPVSGTITVSDDGLVAQFTPVGSLRANTTYTLAIGNGITDLDGEQLEDPSDISFETGAATLAAGTLAFVSTRDGTAHIYLSNPDGSDVRRLTNASEPEFTPSWSPDGQRLAYSTEEGAFVISRDGTGRVLVRRDAWWPTWSPDGKRLLVNVGDTLRIVATDGYGADEVVILPAADNFQGFFSAGAIDVWSPSWSPDGTRIAFSSWTNYDFERAFVVNVDGSNGRAFIGTYRGMIWDECGPVWSPDGTKIAVLGGVFGGNAPLGTYFGAGIVDPASGLVAPVIATGTTCWDSSPVPTSRGGLAWSPDSRALAVTKRSPGWYQGQPTPANQDASIAIVDIATKAVRAIIPDAFDPAWSRNR